MTVHADVSGPCQHELNDLGVTVSGQADVGTIGFDVGAGDEPRAGAIQRVAPAGSVTVAASALVCPTGMVVTNDGRTLIVAGSRVASSPSPSRTA